ncbi:MAG: radical SAM protein [Lachnospiraceae bacterium]|jgi:oxygen-independent coproporphyrinogen-3 oxidase|nr:radical SAM protein [Lachnospiraceae bacterium]
METQYDLNDLFDKGMELFHITNTAYPLTPVSLMQYKITDREKYRGFLEADFEKCTQLSLYVHVPFCKSRCKFCEYVVVSGDEVELKQAYVDHLLTEIKMYGELVGRNSANKPKIVGFDIGGGTPTELEIPQLEALMTAVNEQFDLSNFFTKSIETTPINAVRQFDKLKIIRELGIPRISMGVQTVNAKLLENMQREGGIAIYREAVDNIRRAGFTLLNIDLMYGFKDQDYDDFVNTVNYAISLEPEYITLYEMRYKLTKISSDASYVSKAKLNKQYRLAFEILEQNGYIANYGKNTFSRIPYDEGTSSYLTRRVINATPYIGLGAGAQSFGHDYLAYNTGAANKSIVKYMSDIDEGYFPIQDIYDLPLEESIAKAVSVMFYFGYINYREFYERFKIDFVKRFYDVLKYADDWGLLKLESDRCIITKNGVTHMNGLIPLFYSERSKAELMKTKPLS